ncbi:DUF2690 domain-containing protein [Streptomyces sp. NPDC017454]|uniref:DUF2690 domain-containing protein n=1 Tax=Streptomyces sp. NPDC017454 TaxID=3364997 RepID=UPI0037B8C9DA
MGRFGTPEGQDGTARDGARSETGNEAPDRDTAEPSAELVELIAAIRRCMAELSWSYNVMGRRTDASSSTWNRWCTQIRLPRRDALVSFAKAAPEVVGRHRLLDLWEAARAAQDAASEAGPRAASAEETSTAPSTDPAGSPAAAGRRLRLASVLLSAAGVLALGAGITVWTLGANAGDTTDGRTAPQATTAAPTAVRPSPTVSCHGESCASLDPAHTHCARDAVTAYSGRKYGATIELRHSSSCGTVWAKMSKTSAGDRVTVTHREGPSEEYRQQYGRDAHTFMLPVDIPEDAEACAIVQDRGTVCATERNTASPAPAGRGR